MPKVIIVGNPTKEISRLISEKGLDVEFISESQARERFDQQIQNIPTLDSKTIEKLTGKVCPVCKVGSKYHK